MRLSVVFRWNAILLLLVAGIAHATEHVSNPPAPALGQYPINLREQVWVDERKLTNMSPFMYVHGFQVDSAGDIFFLVYNRVLKVSPEGKLLAVFGDKRGQGPGEFIEYPGEIALDDQDNVYVCDQYKMIVYNKSGERLREFNFLFSSGICVDPSGAIWSQSGEHSSRQVFEKIERFSKFGRKIMVYARFPNADFVSIRPGLGSYYHHPYSTYLRLCRAKDAICFGFGSRYEIHVHDGLTGKEVRRIICTESKSPVTSNEIPLVLKGNPVISSIPDYAKRTPIPKYRPYFNNLLGDEKGRVWVVRVKPLLERTSGVMADVFGVDGRFLYKVNLPCKPLLIRNGVIYAADKITVENEEEYILLKKYVILNYAQMRSSLKEYPH